MAIDKDSTQINHELVRSAREQARTAQPWTVALRHNWSIEGYEPISILQQGGQGIVYEALQKSTGRIVAIKLLRHGVAASPAEHARIQREIQFLGQLRHPNIVTIHDSGIAGNLPYFVMDFIDGLPLDQYVVEENQSNEDTIRLFIEVADAVQAAHLRGIIHRDLKPSNILIDDEGRSHVVDFGLAKLTDDPGQSKMTHTGQFVGSLPWSAPEQASGNVTDIDLRTDVYALGVILYQLLTGRMPYETSGTITEVTQRISEEPAKAPSNHSADIDDDLDTIVLKCLAKEPERRYQTAGELARDLTHFLNGEPIEARRPSMGYLLKKRYQRNRVSVVAAGAVAVAVILGSLGTSIGLIWALREKQHAENAKQQAKQRAEELADVVDFQSAQLSGLDGEQLGGLLRTAVFEHTRRALEQESDPTDVNHSLESLDRALANTNFTSVALNLLEAGIFRESRKAIDKKFENQPLVQAQLLFTLAKTLQHLGLYAEATEPLERCVALRKSELGSEHRETLEAVSALGVQYELTGQHEDALKYCQSALDARRRLFGENDLATLSSLQDMANVYESMGQHEDALELLTESLDRRSKTLDPDDPATLSVQGDLAIVLSSLGRNDEALELFQQTLEGRRRVLGEDDPDTLTSLGNLGYALASMGRYDEALKYIQQEVPANRRVLGNEHPNTLSSIMNLAVLLKMQGDYATALPYYEEVLKARRRLLGNHHPSTLNAIHNLAALYVAMGRYGEALPLSEESLAGRRDVLGNDHQYTITSVSNLGSLLRRMGRLEVALPYYEEALASFRRVLGDDHPRTLTSLDNMSTILRDLGRPEEALPYCMEAMERSREIRAKDHPDTFTTIHNVCVVLHALGRSQAALPYCRESLEGRRHVLGDDHPHTLLTITTLGAVLSALGMNNEAGTLMEDAESDARRVWRGDHTPDLTRFLTVLGNCQIESRKFEAAEQTLTEACDLIAKSPRSDDNGLRACKQRLDKLYNAWSSTAQDSIRNPLAKPSEDN